MVKKVWYLFATLCMLSIFSSCEDEYTGFNGSYKGDKLTLNYSGSPMLGKEVSFRTFDGKKATIKMNGVLDLGAILPNEKLPAVGIGAPGVIPGEPETTLSNVQITARDEAGSSFTFSGKDQANGREFNYSGEVSNTGMVLNITDVKMPHNDFVGTWNLSQMGGLAFTWESNVNLKINIKGTEQEVPTSMAATLLSTMLSPKLAGVLQSVTFNEDGNIVASIMKKGSSTWETSPINLAHYFVKDNKIYLQLNLSQILQTKSKVTDLVQLLTNMMRYLTEGVPLNYEVKADGTTRVYLATEDAKKLLDIVTNEFVMEKLITLIPEDMAPVIKPVLEQLPAVLESTTKLEIGLNIGK